MGTTNILDLNNRASTLEKAITKNAEDVHDSEKDIYAVMGKMGAKNLIPVPYYEDTEEDRGITWTNNADGTITITGTATADSAHNLSQKNNTGKLYLPNGKYILSGCPSGGSNSTFYLEALCTKNSSSTSLGIDSGAGVEITVNGDDYGVDGAFVMVSGIVKNGYAVTNPITFKPMLRLASDTDDTYQPYAKTNRELTESYPANKVMMSDGVTSVEEKMGNMRMTKLWENPSPTASFAAQDITLSSSDYDLLLFMCKLSATYSVTDSYVSPKGMGGKWNLTTIAQNGTQNWIRFATYVNDTIIHVEDAYSVISGGAPTIDNTLLIPYKIYGIKLT